MEGPRWPPGFAALEGPRWPSGFVSLESVYKSKISLNFKISDQKCSTSWTEAFEVNMQPVDDFMIKIAQR